MEEGQTLINCLAYILNKEQPMPRIARMLNGGQRTVYHVISRTALDGYPFGDIEKEELVKIIQNLASFTLSIFLASALQKGTGELYLDKHQKPRYPFFFKINLESGLKSSEFLEKLYRSYP
ncbi:hypothetical protein QUF76_05070 [Desulfobacterales bacterium HSG16]|nr:hypothetical protein [Desulfobacterales bacterium HSG16]